MKKISSFLLAASLVFPFAQPSFASNFSDLQNNHKFYSEIKYLIDEEIISGFPDNTFRPDKTVTRAQAAIMIGRTLELDGKQQSAPFHDVSSDMKASGYIKKMSEMKIIQGFPDGTFRPDEPVTRGQMAIFLSRAFDLKSEEVNFSDVAPHIKAYGAIKEMYGSGITTGYPDNTFRPNKDMLRSEFSAFLYRTMQLENDDTTGENNDEPVEGEEKPVDEPNTDIKTAKEIFTLNNEKVVLINTDKAQGSGIIVGDGLILTNEHVINGMQFASIKLSNGTVVEVEGVVVADPVKDLALIKTKQLLSIEPVSVADTSKLEVGDTVAAIGSPKGLQNTLSTGIISSLRVNENTKLIQTNAAITNGSSGGGLFNQQGELIGITTFRKGETGSLNFAVNISEIESWNNYLSMNFSDIPVQQVEQTLNKVIRGVAMGMTKEEVKRIETGHLDMEDPGMLMYEDTEQYGLPAYVIYSFKNNKLDTIFVGFEGVNALDLDGLETLYYGLRSEVASSFGNPTSVDNEWFDDADSDYILSAFWMPNTKKPGVLLSVKIDKNDYDAKASVLFKLQ